MTDSFGANPSSPTETASYDHADEILDLQRDVLQHLARGAPLDECLDQLCLLVEARIPSSTCVIMQPRDGLLYVSHAPSVDPEVRQEVSGIEPGPRSMSCGTAYYTERPAIAVDIRSDERWVEKCELADRLEMKACWSVPLPRPGEGLFGTFAIMRSELGGPSSAQIGVLNIIATLGSLVFERANADRELREQRDLLESVLQSVQDPIFVKDAEGRYMAANAADCEGLELSPSEILGATDFDLYPYKTAAENTKFDAHVLRTGECVTYEQTFENSLKGTRTFQIRKQPLRSESGDAVGVVGVARDLTDMRRTERAMQESQKLESLGVLVGGIAHDFNNLLTGVIGNVEVALEHQPAGTEVRDAVHLVDEGVGQLADLTRQMLSFAGHGELERGPVDIAAVIRDVRSVIASSISKKAALSFEFEPELPLIEADATQLRQVAMNLVLNASEALEEAPGEIRVRCRRSDSEILLEVQDTGCGVDEETRSRMFEPFFTTKFTGRGLGLAATAGIVRSHRGTISVKSEQGEGTTIGVTLPIGTPAEAATNAPQAPQSQLPRHGRILVVDDEPGIRKLARLVLTGHGYTVVTAEDGREAVEIIQSDASEFCAVLLDQAMPELGGSDVLRILDKSHPELPVVLTSGFNAEGTSLGPNRPGAFLQKPYRSAQLLAAMDAACATDLG